MSGFAGCNTFGGTYTLRGAVLGVTVGAVTRKACESAVHTMLEGRFRVGYRFGPVGLGATVGYGDPYNYRRSSRARPFIGGLQLGLYADWRE